MSWTQKAHARKLEATSNCFAGACLSYQLVLGLALGISRAPVLDHFEWSKPCVLLLRALLMSTMPTLSVSHSISASLLAKKLGHSDSPLICDVRRAAAFDQSTKLIAGALRLAPELIDSAHTHLPRDRSVVVYCVHGHEVSQNASAQLRALHVNAVFLEGGIAEWEALGLATMVKNSTLGVAATPGKPSRWVTRERPKIDRIACPWLIRRFIDPCAQFLYVPSNEVLAIAATQGATPYDVPEVLISHRGPEGERCSFDALIDECGLDDPCLLQLAKIVRGADTGRPELSDQSAGLLAISLGLSHNFSDDHAMLEQGMVIYDALYAWIKSAQGEVHNAALFKNPA
jgi:rhodanese-related sulfurtransferase